MTIERTENFDAFRTALEDYRMPEVIEGNVYNVFNLPGAAEIAIAAEVILDKALRRPPLGRYPLDLVEGGVRGFDYSNAAGKFVIIVDRAYNADRLQASFSQVAEYMPLGFLYISREPIRIQPIDIR